MDAHEAPQDDLEGLLGTAVKLTCDTFLFSEIWVAFLT